MITFIAIAAAMVLAVAALLAVPLLSRRPVAPQSPRTALVVLVVLCGGAAGLYAAFSNWNWSKPQAESADASPQTMVGTLARRLASHPDDLNGWLLLGRSYGVLQETPLAVHAYERANQLAKGENVDALLGLAEQLVAQDDSLLAGRAGDLVEKALTLAPQSPKALFYGAAAAIQRKQLPLARQRFVSLLAENPPENVRPIIQQQITAIDQALAAAGPARRDQRGRCGHQCGGCRPGAAGRACGLLSSSRLRLAPVPRATPRCLCSCAIRGPADPRWRSSACRHSSRRPWNCHRRMRCWRGMGSRSARMWKSSRACPVRGAAAPRRGSFWISGLPRGRHRRGCHPD